MFQFSCCKYREENDAAQGLFREFERFISLTSVAGCGRGRWEPCTSLRHLCGGRGTPAQVVPHLTTLREECQEKESHEGKRFLRIVSRFASAYARREAKDFCELSCVLRTLWHYIGVESDGDGDGKLGQRGQPEKLCRFKYCWTMSGASSRPLRAAISPPLPLADCMTPPMGGRTSPRFAPWSTAS